MAGRPRIQRTRQQAAAAQERAPKVKAPKAYCKCLWQCCTSAETGPHEPVRLVKMCESASAKPVLLVCTGA